MDRCHRGAELERYMACAQEAAQQVLKDAKDAGGVQAPVLREQVNGDSHKARLTILRYALATTVEAAV